MCKRAHDVPASLERLPMTQEMTIHYPAFKAIVAFASPNEENKSILDAPLRVTDQNLFTKRRHIPLGWFKSEKFRDVVLQRLGANNHPRMTRFIFNTKPVVRVCNAGSPDERRSQPEIVEWTSLGGWSATPLYQNFKAPDWTTKFVQL